MKTPFQIDLNGKVAVIICIIVLFVIAFTQKKDKA